MDTQNEINNPEPPTEGTPARPWSRTPGQRSYVNPEAKKTVYGFRMRVAWAYLDEIGSMPAPQARKQFSHGTIARMEAVYMIKIQDNIIYPLYEWIKTDTQRRYRTARGYAAAKRAMHEFASPRAIPCPDARCQALAGQPCKAARWGNAQRKVPPCYMRLIMWGQLMIKAYGDHPEDIAALAPKTDTI